MSINPLYIPLFNIEEVILDKDTGLPLAYGVVRFFVDSQPATAKPVFQITGTSPDYSFAQVGTELTLGLSGTFVDLNGNPFVPYAYPYDVDGNLQLYYVTVESAGGVPQFVRKAVPYVNSTTIPPADRANTENELANPQFVEVNFPTTGTVTLSLSGTNTVTSVAPGWDLVTTGTGTVELERLEPVAANVPTNPPYALRILASAGLGSSVTLRQRLTNTPSIFRNGYASGSFVAAVISGGASFVTMTYAPSSGSSRTVIPSTSVATDGAYHIIQNNTAIPDQPNPAASTGYIDINITLPTQRSIAISSIQILGTSYSVNIPYDEQTVARQKDHLFHYYETATVRQPKKSLLAGWIFGLNPWQYTTSASTNVADNRYTADQTIIIQQNYVDTNTGNNVAVSGLAYAKNGAFEIKAVTATNKVMMLQYVDPSTMKPYWNQTLSAMLRASISTLNSTAVTFKVRLMYKNALPAVLSRTDPVSSWSSTNDSIPTLAAGWTYLTSTNDPTYTLTSTVQDFAFDGFVLPASTSSTMTLAIAFIMMKPMVETGTPDVINIESVSLVNNDFAIKAQPDTYDESLRKCQYYYEQSYNIGVLPGAASTAGAYSSQVASNAGAAAGLNTPYKVTKLTTPTIVWYSTSTGTADRIYDIDAAADKTVTSTAQTGVGNTGYPNVSVNITDGHTVIGHWTAAARLGVEYHS